jgi:S-(hydroxymethyl)glutathione dehydrogenase / alcohol dehydrogenase
VKAAIFHGAHEPLTIEEIEIDKPKDHEIVVKTMASGVCHSDLHFIDGLYPMRPPSVLGHETAGIVEEVGESVTYVKPGDHVIACLSIFCGFCNNCMSGRPHLCQNRAATMRGRDETPRLSWHGQAVGQMANLGSFAEKMLLHENAVVKIREDYPFDRAALIGCGVTTGVGAALNTAKVEPGSTVAVFGCGGVGLSVIQGARIAGARMIIALDTFENKLAIAREVGATHIIDCSSTDPVEKIVEMTGGGADYTFEAIGSAKAAEQCFDALCRGGTATVIGMIPVGHKVELTGSAFLGEKKIQGSSMGSNRFRIDMPNYIEFDLQGRLKLDQMITRRLPLDEVNEAFRAMKAGEVARSVLMFE